MKRVLIALLASLFLTCCKGLPQNLPTPDTLAPVTPTTRVIDSSTPVLPTPTDSPDKPKMVDTQTIQCQTTFNKRELNEPYQRQDDQPRYTLPEDTLKAYLDVMGIESICIPEELGAPFLNVDWNSADIPAKGRMVSLGFENTYTGAGWSDVHLVYATYDFSVGSEYNTFAQFEDWEALQSGSMPNIIQNEGSQGFVRFKAADYSMGAIPFYKTLVFPSQTHYLAVVYQVGVYAPDSDPDAITSELQRGNFPDDLPIPVEIVDYLGSSIEFKHNPEP